MDVFVVGFDDLRIYFTVWKFVPQGRHTDSDIAGGGL